MTRNQTIGVAAIATILALLVVFAFWRAGIACSTPRHRLALDIDKAAGCYEFWFNRYQAGIGGALTIVAAIIAGTAAILAAKIAAKPVILQLKFARSQAAIAALPVLLHVREMITAELAAMDRIDPLRNKLKDWIKIGQETPDILLNSNEQPLRDLQEHFAKIATELAEMSRKNPFESDGDNARRFLAQLAAMKRITAFADFLAKCRKTNFSLEGMRPKLVEHLGWIKSDDTHLYQQHSETLRILGLHARQVDRQIHQAHASIAELHTGKSPDHAQAS